LFEKWFVEFVHLIGGLSRLLARMRAEYEAAKPSFRSCHIWGSVTPALMGQIEAERALYAVRPSMSEVVNQLLTEALAFRRMHRSPPPPARHKRVPFPGLA
jgi:hypothetical protein